MAFRTARPRPDPRALVSSSMLVALCLALPLACAPREAAGPSASPHVAVDEARLALLTRSIAQEDAPRAGVPKPLTVNDQLREEREAVARGVEGSVAKLEAAYLASALCSTDAPRIPGPWAVDATRDRLGSATVETKLLAWQPIDKPTSFIKFAVVADAGGALEMRVGRSDIGHVDIAGGTALAAGVLRVRREGEKIVVAEIENTSGGFRPGVLRNRTALAAIEAAGRAPSPPAKVIVHDNPTGNYDASTMVPSPRR